jgi:hypothetical protein
MQFGNLSTGDIPRLRPTAPFAQSRIEDPIRRLEDGVFESHSPTIYNLFAEDMCLGKTNTQLAIFKFDIDPDLHDYMKQGTDACLADSIDGQNVRLIDQRTSINFDYQEWKTHFLAAAPTPLLRTCDHLIDLFWNAYSYEAVRNGAKNLQIDLSFKGLNLTTRLHLDGPKKDMDYPCPRFFTTFYPDDSRRWTRWIPSRFVDFAKLAKEVAGDEAALDPSQIRYTETGDGLLIRLGKSGVVHGGVPAPSEGRINLFIDPVYSASN